MKRRALFLVGVAAILPSAIAASAGVPAQSAATAHFAPPSTPLLLTRTIWRSLHDGKTIVSQRRYRIRIVPHGDGYEVNGELIDSSVEAPPPLAALAEMERTRPDGALFPAYLDSNGRIIDPPSAGQATFNEGPALRQKGAREARRIAADSAAPNPGQAQITSFIDQIVNGSGAAPWPSDLFNPAQPEWREQRRIALPDGSEGEITVTVAAHGQSSGGLPSSVERTVVTELGGTRKVSREQWTIEAGAG